MLPRQQTAYSRRGYILQVRPACNSHTKRSNISPQESWLHSMVRRHLTICICCDSLGKPGRVYWASTRCNTGTRCRTRVQHHHTRGHICAAPTTTICLVNQHQLCVSLLCRRDGLTQMASTAKSAVLAAAAASPRRLILGSCHVTKW